MSWNPKVLPRFSEKRLVCQRMNVLDRASIYSVPGWSFYGGEVHVASFELIPASEVRHLFKLGTQKMLPLPII